MTDEEATKLTQAYPDYEHYILWSAPKMRLGGYGRAFYYTEEAIGWEIHRKVMGTQNRNTLVPGYGPYKTRLAAMKWVHLLNQLEGLV